MSSNEFIEPKPFSIDQNILENALMNIGSGGSKKQAHAKKDEVVFSSSDNNFNKIASSISSLPEQYQQECLTYIESQINKFKRNIVCKNTNKISSVECILGKQKGQIIYKESSIQGNWTGLEVIIEGDNSELIVAKANGEDWQNVTNLFKIS